MFHELKNLGIRFCVGSIFLISLVGCRKSEVAQGEPSRQLEVAAFQKVDAEEGTEVDLDKAEWLYREDEGKFVLVRERAGDKEHPQIPSPQNTAKPPGDYNLEGWPPGPPPSEGPRLPKKLDKRFKMDER